MYLPNHFKAQAGAAKILMDAYPFATLISQDEAGASFVNHFPILLKTTADGALVLEGHMARNNPQWSHFKQGSRALAIFHGPHAYITPRWYVSGRDVPTWNYAVVHASGSIKLIEDFEGLNSLLARLTERFEAENSEPWVFGLPEDLKSAKALTGAIIGFEINVDKIETKFKLSQNRPIADKEAVIHGLGERTDSLSRAVRELMLEER